MKKLILVSTLAVSALVSGLAAAQEVGKVISSTPVLRRVTEAGKPAEDRLIGYKVVYEYNGTRGTVQLPFAPGPTIELDIQPAAVQSSSRVSAPQPLYTPGEAVSSSSQPLYSNHQVISDSPPVVYSQPTTVVTQPVYVEPAYYYPARTYYTPSYYYDPVLPALAIGVGLGYVARGGWGWGRGWGYRGGWHHR